MAVPRLAGTRLIWGLAIIAGATLSSAGHAGSVLYVDDDAPPGGDGASWDTAYRFLQDALTDASGGGITEIRTAQGTYLPDRDEANPDGSGDREATFGLIDGVALMGGYAGLGAPDPDARDIDLYETILSGDLLGNDGPDFANNDENSYHVVTGIEGLGTAIIDGFVISAGNADGEADWMGGGIVNNLYSLTLTQCTLTGNSAEAGGAMFSISGLVVVTRCTFSDNSAETGGGVLILSSTATIINSTFSGNVAQSSGGGMANVGSSPTLTNCTFTGNTAGSGGGGLSNVVSSPTVTNCTFTDNAAGAGGGMSNVVSSPTVTNCTFSDNAAGGGGGMYNHSGSNPTVTNCTFSGNSANSSDGGGMDNGNGSNPTVSNCTFSANFATESGGGMFNAFDSSSIVTNCTFTCNTAAFNGGGISDAFDANSIVTNSTFSCNTAFDGGGIYTSGSSTVTNCILWNDSPTEISDVGGSIAGVLFSDIQGGWTGSGGHNIDADPLFVDPDDGDYRLSSGSPCIDAGNNWGVPRDSADLDDDGDTSELTPFDLDDNPRFVHAPIDPHPGCGVPVIVDMGAYEFQEGTVDQPVYGDLNGDGMVSMVDLLILLDSWGLCEEGCCLADLDIDGGVGILDLLMLLANWG